MKNTKNILIVISILGICASVFTIFIGEPVSTYLIGLTSSGGLLCGALDMKEESNCNQST